MEEYNACPICCEEYDDDPDQIADKATSHLPVQSSKCRHVMCFSCVKTIWMGRGEKVSDKSFQKMRWLECQMCRTKTCFNAEAPVVCAAVCDLIKEIRSRSTCNSSSSVPPMTNAAPKPSEPEEEDERLPLDAAAPAKPRNAKVWNKVLKDMLKKKVKSEKGKVDSFFAAAAKEQTKWEKCLSAISSKDADEVYVSSTKQVVGLPKFVDNAVRSFCEGVVTGDPKIYLSPEQFGYMQNMKIPSGSFAILMVLHEGAAGDVHSTDTLKEKSGMIIGREMAPTLPQLRGEPPGSWSRGIGPLEKHKLVERSKKGGQKHTFTLTKKGKIFARALVSSREIEVKYYVKRDISDILAKANNSFEPSANSSSKAPSDGGLSSTKFPASMSSSAVVHSADDEDKFTTGSSSEGSSDTSFSVDSNEDCSVTNKGSSSADLTTDEKRKENRLVDVDSAASKIPIGDIGYTFKKKFRGHGIFEGEVVDILLGAKDGKDRRCYYAEDGDIEDLSMKELRALARQDKEGEEKGDSDDDIGSVGYKFKKNFPGYGVFEGEVVEILAQDKGGKDRRCQYEDGYVKDMSLKELRALASKPTNKRSASSQGHKRSKKKK